VPRVSINYLNNPFVSLMNEIYRCLKVGGVFLSYTPAYPYSSSFSDPTHVNIITEDTFPNYFSSDPFGRWDVPMAKIYGFYGNFVLIKQFWIKDHLVTILGKLDN
jgi:SAM-dependent methyltransferase